MTSILSSTPAPLKVARSTLKSEGLHRVDIGGNPVVMPINFDSMLMGGVFNRSVIIQTQSNTSSTFGTSTQLIDFNIAGQGAQVGVDLFSKVFCEVTITNTEVTDALTLPNIFYSLNQLQLLLDGNSVKQYQLSQQMESTYAGATARIEHQTNYANYGYADSTFTSSTTTVAAGATRVFQIPLHTLFPEITRFPLKALRTPMTIRLFFNPGAGWLSSASVGTTLRCDQIRIVCDGSQLSGESNQVFADSVRGGALSIPIINPQTRTLNFGALTAAESAPVITNLSGAVAQIRCYLYDAPPTTAQSKLATVSFTDSKFKDSMGSIINIGGSANFEQLSYSSSHFAEFMRIIPQSVGCSLASAAVLKWVDQGPSFIFCKNIAKTLTNDVRHGCLSCSGTETMQVTGTYTNLQAMLFFDVLGQFVIKDGGQALLISMNQ